MIKKIFKNEKFKVLASSLFLIVVIIGAIFVFKHYSKKEIKPTIVPLEESQSSVAPVDFTLPMVDDSSNSISESSTYQDYGRAFGTFHVISESLTAENLNGNGTKVYHYGDTIYLRFSEEVVVKNGSGAFIKESDGNNYFLKDKTGLVIDSFWPIYQKVFSVAIDSYKKLPLEIKYQILGKAGTLSCSLPDTHDASSSVIEAIFAGDVPKQYSSYMNSSGLFNCSVAFYMPKSEFIADHAVAYANLDDDPKTPDNVLVITENSQNNYGSNCSGNLMIFSTDADGKYYTKNLNDINGVCYIDSIKKGTVIQTIKKTFNNNGTIETKNSLTIPTDSFVVHTDNDKLIYLLYDKTTSTQVKKFDPISSSYADDYNYSDY